MHSPPAAVTSFLVASSLLKLLLLFMWLAPLLLCLNLQLMKTNILKIDTAVNPADMFTKGLVVEKCTAI
jgi:hypothetical protein